MGCGVIGPFEPGVNPRVEEAIPLRSTRGPTTQIALPLMMDTSRFGAAQHRDRQDPQTNEMEKSVATETKTAAGHCNTHGAVEATREIPRVTFPPVGTAVRRAAAKCRRPYLCPTCGAEVETD